MKLGWGGEADMVEEEAFRPVFIELNMRFSDDRLLSTKTTATPDIQYDTAYVRREVGGLLNLLIDELLKVGVIDE